MRSRFPLCVIGLTLLSSLLTSAGCDDHADNSMAAPGSEQRQADKESAAAARQDEADQQKMMDAEAKQAAARPTPMPKYKPGKGE